MSYSKKITFLVINWDHQTNKSQDMVLRCHYISSVSTIHYVFTVDHHTDFTDITINHEI